MFPTKFPEMKGIVGDIEEMKIPLNLDTKRTKQQDRVIDSIKDTKKKFKIELYIVLYVSIIEHVEESEWMIPMLVQDKKIGELPYLCRPEEA